MRATPLGEGAGQHAFISIEGGGAAARGELPDEASGARIQMCGVEGALALIVNLAALGRNHRAQSAGVSQLFSLAGGPIEHEQPIARAGGRVLEDHFVAFRREGVLVEIKALAAARHA